MGLPSILQEAKSMGWGIPNAREAYGFPFLLQLQRCAAYESAGLLASSAYSHERLLHETHLDVERFASTDSDRGMGIVWRSGIFDHVFFRFRGSAR